MNNEFILSTRADHVLFEAIGTFLEKELRLQTISRLSGIDQGYWEFKVERHQFRLHLEHYTGISIHPAQAKSPDEEGLKLIHFVTDLIRKKFQLR
jgi:hypothetical protein